VPDRRRASEAADLVFFGASVVSRGRPLAGVDALAVSNGRIHALGRSADLRDLVDTRTEVVQMRDRSLMPGFQDAHVHPVAGGLGLLQCDLSEETTTDGYLRLIDDYARRSPNLDWITGSGWSMDVFPGGRPTRELLDRVVTDRPAYFRNRDSHGSWANSRALSLAGIDAHTPDPTGGRIERDPDGAPTGLLHESASELVAAQIPEPTDDAILDALEVGQRHLHSLGITAWQDAIVGNYLGMPNPLRTYVRAAENGILTARVVGALWWQPDKGDEQIADLVDLRERCAVGRFKPTTVKIMLDGIVETRTASMLAPYCGHEHEPSATSFVDPQALKVYVTLLDRAGFQVHIHAVGDRAVREALDAIDEARRVNGPNDNRHQIAHLDVVHPDDQPRFAALGVVANIQPLWATHEPQMDQFKLPLLGPERSQWSFPFGALEHHRTPLAAGSDWMVSSADPLAGIHVAVHRTRADLTDPPFLPEQRLDLATALEAYTAGSAWANHLDHATGTLEVGKRADLVALDCDLHADPLQPIADSHVIATYVDGQAVHRS